MSVAGINGLSTLWQWQTRATQASSATAVPATAPQAGGSIGNTGSVAAANNLFSFVQALSSDLQAMLTQLGNDIGVGGTAAATGTVAAQGSPGQVQGAVHHQQHGADHDADDASASGQPIGRSAGSAQGGTLAAGQFTQSASLIAADIVQALQSYAPAGGAGGAGRAGGTGPAGGAAAASSILA